MRLFLLAEEYRESLPLGAWCHVASLERRTLSGSPLPALTCWEEVSS